MPVERPRNLMDLSRSRTHLDLFTASSPAKAKLASARAPLAQRWIELGCGFVQNLPRGLGDQHGKLVADLKNNCQRTPIKPAPAPRPGNLKQLVCSRTTLVIWGANSARHAAVICRRQRRPRSITRNCFTMWMAGLRGEHRSLRSASSDDFRALQRQQYTRARARPFARPRPSCPVGFESYQKSPTVSPGPADFRLTVCTGLSVWRICSF